MLTPSTWVVDRTGDLLHLDGSVSVVQVRADLVRACDGQADIHAHLPKGSLIWTIRGRGWRLQAAGGIERAIRVAALSSEWRELPLEPAPAAAAEAVRLFDTVTHPGVL